MANFKNIHKSLDRCYKSAVKIKMDITEIKLVLFSDHHRGRRDGADDFLICEETYIAALNQYSKDDYSLGLLGDVEEFWENSFLSVMMKYKEILELEKDFYDKKKLYRIWGNHDDAWKFADTIRRHLGWLFPNIAVYEGINLQIEKAGELQGEIFMVHGHQGSAESDRFSAISKWFVKYIWRNFQRIFKVPLSTPANNLKLKSRHDMAMYQWAEKNKRTIICGHTHQPVFLSLTHEEKILNEIDEIQQKIKDDSADEETKRKMELLMSKVHTHLVENNGEDILNKKKPCYFNTGCCSFSDGDITGIELADGMVRLVKWGKKSKQRIVLEEVELNYVLSENKK